MSEEQVEYGDPRLDFDYEAEVEILLYRYWKELAEPKVGYVQWMYPHRKLAVRILFTKEVINNG